jgi:AbrB family looped-hinge helix DNA binding protein
LFCIPLERTKRKLVFEKLFGVLGQMVLFLLVRIGAFMAGYATTKLSSKGQIVIPEEIRKNLHLQEGDQFVVIGKGDTVILKSITPPSLEQFDDLIREARSHAKKAGIKKSDVTSAIKKARRG